MSTKLKIIIICFFVTAVGVGIYKIIENNKKTDNNPDENTGNSGSGTKPTPVSSSSIGKKAYASLQPTWVRSDTKIVESYGGAVNNRVGEIDKGGLIGSITGVIEKGTDGNQWYMVKSESDFDCPFWDCGVTFSTNIGYVKVKEVTIK